MELGLDGLLALSVLQSGMQAGTRPILQPLAVQHKHPAPQHAPSPHPLWQVVEPKIAKLRESEAELKVATRERQAVEEELAVVQAKLDEMQAQFDAAMAQKQVGGWVRFGGMG